MSPLVLGNQGHVPGKSPAPRSTGRAAALALARAPPQRPPGECADLGLGPRPTRPGEASHRQADNDTTTSEAFCRK